jgi:DNA-binding MarR family transcriptional regulator
MAVETGTAVEFDLAFDEFVAAMRRARGRAAAEAEAEGLSLAQYQLLYAFLDRGRGDSVSVGALAESAGIAQPTATRTLDGLERQGVIERRPSTEDRRSVTVHLTASGRKLLDRKRALVDAKRRALFESLDPGDREGAARLLRALAAAVDPR